MLPRYPFDKIIVMELCHQLVYVHERQSYSHKTGLKSSQSIGRYIVTTTPKAKNMGDKMKWVTMKRFKAYNNFDFHGMNNKIYRNYLHVH